MTDDGVPQRLGRYELLAPIAQGGTASIYLARTAGPGDFERHVALKVLHATRAEDPDACKMFVDEARVVAMLHHHNVASVLDVDVDEHGRHFLAMEYVHGVDLRALLAAAAGAATTLSYETAIAIVLAAAAGLGHAHDRCDPRGRPLRLVHRDVSLSNVMVGHDGSVKVVDFGIATTTLATVHTCPGIVRGKASYMSPEQCMGDEVDRRTDVFALGIVLYELTTGVRCFAGKSDFDRMLAVVRGTYHAPRALVPDFPEDLEHVIRTALATRASDRYPDAAALIEALERVLRDRGWPGGAKSIARTMRALFGEVPEPWAALPQAPRVARGTAPPPEVTLARGSAPKLAPPERGASDTPRGSDLGRARAFAPLADDEDEDDEPTRGRRAFRRPPTSRPIVSG